jgi:hypothetical protein
MPSTKNNKPRQTMYVFYNTITKERLHSMDMKPPTFIHYNQVFEYELKAVYDIEFKFNKKGA